jgi:hypothetical protein
MGFAKTGRLVLLGVKGCNNQYHDQPNNRGDIWYPVGERIAEVITRPRNYELPVLQADFGNDSDNIDLIQQATDLMLDRTAAWIRGVQYDSFPWDSPKHTAYMRRLKSTHPALKLIVQCTGPMMKQYGAKGICQLLAERNDFIDYALFDSSCGQGKPLDPEMLRSFVNEAYSSDELATMNFGVAGGLSGDSVTMYRLRVLLSEYPELSFDAESRLHFPGGQFGGKLMPEAVKGYLAVSGELLQEL